MEDPDEFPEAVELEALAIQDLPAAQRGKAFRDLCSRYPDHVGIIKALAGLSRIDEHKAEGGSDAVVRIGPYRVERWLGEGGMGRVFLCHADESENLAEVGAAGFAIKVIRPEAGPDLLRRFEREAKTLRQLRHVGIARFFESGHARVEHADGGSIRLPFLALEYVDGVDLITFVQRHQLDARSRLQLMQRVCEGLAHAHACGVVHRDIKPANILVSDDGDGGQPKILDFGIAQASWDDNTAKLTATGQRGLLGTAPYMSPEQLHQGTQNLDARSDVYSLGVVMFELLAGQLPYALTGRSLAEVARIISDQEPTQLGSIDTSYRGSPIETIVAKALEKDPKWRYADADAVRSDLANLLSDIPIKATRASSWRRTLKFSRRHRVLVSTAIGTMLALSVGLVIAVRFAIITDAVSARALRLAYHANLAAASSALADFDVTGARTALQNAPEELRGWEWEHFNSRLDDSLVSLSTDVRNTNIRWPQIELRESAENSWLAIGHSPTPALFRIRPDTGVEESFRWAHRVPVALAGHGAFLATHDDQIRRLALSGPRDWQSERRIEFDRCSVVASPDEKGFAAILADGSCQVLPTIGPMQTYQLADWVGGLRALAVHLREGWVLAAKAASKTREHADDDVRLWRFADPSHPVILRVPRSQKVHACTASYDGRWLAIAAEDGVLTLWRIPAAGPPVLTREMFGHEDAVTAVQFSRDSSRLISGGEDKTLREWSVSNGAPLRLHVGHTTQPRALRLSADAQTLASIDTRGDFRLWASGADPRTIPHPEPVSSAVIDGERVITGAGDGRIRVFDLDSSELIASLKPFQVEERIQLAVHSGQIVASCYQEMAILDAASGEVIARPAASVRRDTRHLFSPDGTELVVFTASTGLLEVRRTTDWGIRRRLELDLRGPVRSVIIYSPESRAILHAGTAGTVVARDSATLAPIATTASAESVVRAMAFDSSGEFLYVGRASGMITSYHWPELAPVAEFRAHFGAIWSIVFAPDDSLLVTTSSGRDIKLWDPATRELVVKLPGHRDFVGAVDWSADGRSMVSASGDRTLRIWDTLPLRARLAARNTYRRFANQNEASIEVLVRTQPNAAIDTLQHWPQWTAREREIAAQLWLRACLRVR